MESRQAPPGDAVRCTREKNLKKKSLSIPLKLTINLELSAHFLCTIHTGQEAVRDAG